jgi:hypothetical protein
VRTVCGGYVDRLGNTVVVWDDLLWVGEGTVEAVGALDRAPRKGERDSRKNPKQSRWGLVSGAPLRTMGGGDGEW